jgi:hypothetical protein
MDNIDFISEKRANIIIGVFAVVFSFLIYHLSISMSVLPHSEAIVYAPSLEWPTRGLDVE